MTNPKLENNKLILTFEESEEGLSFKAQGHIGARCVASMSNMLAEFCANLIVAAATGGSDESEITVKPVAVH
jgi:hypothetical protein